MQVQEAQSAKGVSAKAIVDCVGLRLDLNFVRSDTDVRDSPVSSTGCAATGGRTWGSSCRALDLELFRSNRVAGIGLVVEEGPAGKLPDRNGRSVYGSDRGRDFHSDKHLREDVSSIRRARIWKCGCGSRGSRRQSTGGYDRWSSASLSS